MRVKPGKLNGPNRRAGRREEERIRALAARRCGVRQGRRDVPTKELAAAVPELPYDEALALFRGRHLQADAERAGRISIQSKLDRGEIPGEEPKSRFRRKRR
jgi:hypothetical protein